jgi:histidyl-tRNA synthetase
MLADTARAWEYLQATAQELFARYGYEPIYTPLFEHTEIFTRGIGEATDIVAKEMYTFEDKGGRSITLRPEGTASVVRAARAQLGKWPGVETLLRGSHVPLRRPQRPDEAVLADRG